VQGSTDAAGDRRLGARDSIHGGMDREHALGSLNMDTIGQASILLRDPISR
jgi:hypothetical protein